MGCLVGIDYGTKRTGLAYTDPNKIIASGLKNLPTYQVISYLKQFCETETVDCFIVGKPLQKDGTPSEVESQIKVFVEELKRNFPDCKIERYDERFTSKMALQAMIDGGLKKRQRSDKGMVDQVSATIILQSYLNHKMNSI
jgi:putative Holliday junction resolvase